MILIYLRQAKLLKILEYSNPTHIETSVHQGTIKQSSMTACGALMRQFTKLSRNSV